MKKRYGSVATGSAALDRLAASLTQWVGLQTLSRCAQIWVVFHGESAEKQGIPECWVPSRRVAPPARIPAEQEARQR
eukprot:6871332-Lingulodinium_polyedra.AAC.1